ncbi:MAG: dihydroxy-acid dehydratase [Ginsengibacter sp.]
MNQENIRDEKFTLRSHAWFWGANETGLLHRGALRSAGIDMEKYNGQPIIGIANTWSELNNCNLSLKNVCADVKQGIIDAGGIPLEFPVISLGEELMKPSAMLYRNLLSMEVEEQLRAYPIDGVVLLGNCDKTVPGLLMGAVSANLPAIQLNGGPKEVGVHKGKRLGSGTDLWKYWDALRKGEINNTEWEQIGKCLSCGVGSCNTMGTASTMNGLVEVLGLMPLGSSTMPVDATERSEVSKEAGRRIVQMVYENVRPADILTDDAINNAVKVLMALGGSTNAIIHLTAIAGRLNKNIFPVVFNEAGKNIPCLANTQPSGEFLIDDFHKAGGIPGVICQLSSRLNMEAKTYSGKSLNELIKGIVAINENIIRPLSNPVSEAPSITIITGNLAPQGAVIKVSSASKDLLIHTGKAVVFENYSDMLDRIDDTDLPVTPSSVLILRNAGPKGVPGMPEWGMIPIPKKLQLLGVTDMVRISDARMSGTSFGTVILHVSPEAFTGGPLAAIKTGDMIQINIPEKKINVLIEDDELISRMASLTLDQGKHIRGYPKLYIKEVLQANEGCDFDFLRPRSQEELQFIEPVVGRS